MHKTKIQPRSAKLGLMVSAVMKARIGDKSSWEESLRYGTKGREPEPWRAPTIVISSSRTNRTYSHRNGESDGDAASSVQVRCGWSGQPATSLSGLKIFASARALTHPPCRLSRSLQSSKAPVITQNDKSLILFSSSPLSDGSDYSPIGLNCPWRWSLKAINNLVGASSA